MTDSGEFRFVDYDGRDGGPYTTGAPTESASGACPDAPGYAHGRDAAARPSDAPGAPHAPGGIRLPLDVPVRPATPALAAWVAEFERSARSAFAVMVRHIRARLEPWARSTQLVAHAHSLRLAVAKGDRRTLRAHRRRCEICHPRIPKSPAANAAYTRRQRNRRRRS